MFTKNGVSLFSLSTAVKWCLQKTNMHDVLIDVGI